jgi:ABC-type multidrug transport system ATPase subunit
MVSDPFVIETADLRKTYDGVEAVRGLNLEVPAGSICGFLGRNGAGKTTTIKVLLGMTRPTGGGRARARVRPPGRGAAGERGNPAPHRLCQ